METRKEILKHLSTFVTITIILTTITLIWMSYGPGNSMVAVALMMWTPGIAAILTSLIYNDSIRSYGWKPGKARYLVYSYVLPAVVALIAYGLVWLSGYAEIDTSDVIDRANMFGFTPPAPFVSGVLLTVF